MKYCIIVLCMAVLSCGERNKTNNKISVRTITIDSLSERTINLSNLVEDVQYIKLETVDNSLIGEIHKVIISDDRIFVLDRVSAKSVYAFDRAGNFITKLGDRGRGPGEYLAPQDIAFDVEDQRVIVYDKQTKRMIFYDASDGNYITEIPIGLNFRSFEFLNKDTIISFNHNIYNSLVGHGELPYDLISFNTDQEVLATQFYNGTKIGVGNTVMTTNRYFSNSDKDGIFLNWFFCDTIYHLDGVRAHPFLYVDFGPKKLTEVELSENDGGDEIMEKLIAGDKRAIIRPIQVANGQMLIAYSAGINEDNPDDNPMILYDLKTEQVIKFRDIRFGKNRCKWDIPIGNYRGFFVNVIYHDRFGCVSDKGMEERDTYDDYNNPILMLSKFKSLTDISDEI